MSSGIPFGSMERAGSRYAELFEESVHRMKSAHIDEDLFPYLCDFMTMAYASIEVAIIREGLFQIAGCVALGIGSPAGGSPLFPEIADSFFASLFDGGALDDAREKNVLAALLLAEESPGAGWSVAIDDDEKTRQFAFGKHFFPLSCL